MLTLFLTVPVSFLGPIPVLVISNIYSTRENLEVLAGCFVSLWCVFIIFVVASVAVDKIFNVYIIGITITIVVVIISRVW